MSVKLTHEEWLVKYKKLIHPNLRLLSEYDGVRSKIQVRCTVCGNTYGTLPSVLISGCNCKHCSRSKTDDVFRDELRERCPTVTPIDRYISDRDKIHVKCNVCGYEWNARPTHLLRGHACSKCSHRKLGFDKRKTQQEFEDELKIYNPTIKCLGEYKGRMRHVTVQSTICGHIWSAAPNNLIFGASGCPICMMSKGEKSIHYYLRENNIDFVSQKEFAELTGVNNGNLSYDFYLPEHNLLIEYQGEYHDGTAFNQSKNAFENQQEHDKRKRDYALKHNIELLEIWYYDYDNIEQILSEKLNINNIEKSA